MPHSNFIYRLSRRKPEQHDPPPAKVDSKQSTLDTSWRRRSLASIRRRLSSGPKAAAPGDKPGPKETTLGPVTAPNKTTQPTVDTNRPIADEIDVVNGGQNSNGLQVSEQHHLTTNKQNGAAVNGTSNGTVSGVVNGARVAPRNKVTKSHKRAAVEDAEKLVNGNAAPVCPYNKSVEVIRAEEYPHMNQGTYLDHSGATIPAVSTLHRTTALLTTSLYGNPHSSNAPAARSGAAVDAIRLATLRFLGADPDHFDLVFTANATAAIKLVADTFRDLGEGVVVDGKASGVGVGKKKGGGQGGFWYGYHRDAHTSLVGVRELTGKGGQHCFGGGDAEIERWLSLAERHAHDHGNGVAVNGYARDGTDDDGESDPDADDNDNDSWTSVGRHSSLGLVGWPGQSNLTGRRTPNGWAGRIRRMARNGRHRSTGTDTYSLLDAAALAMTADMKPVFADPAEAPDFACVSFYKIFGFPDLGGLVVRKDSGHILTLRKYFGGGTVSLVSTVSGAWHMSKGESVGAGAGGADEHGATALHDALEDGTLPFHSILALGEAIEVHAQVFGSMGNISAYTTALARRMYNGMKQLRYENGQALCKIYEEGKKGTGYGDAKRQGATIAFNVVRADGGYESYATVERLANERGIYVRSGGICCPGGLYVALQYQPWQLNRAKSAGHHCGPDGISVIHELPTGVVRASLGAMSTVQDVDRFITFLREVFISQEDSAYASSNGNGSVASV
ncbi:putative molybdenum cofactor sulfurase [Dichotomopilus funicola]|uniref:Molybdenum cofactor sulfurase n=1 Tax=Dichotomopilus funicola TaxID=1934379 RepID=A0AAN6V663_9PEZI|nr:putative molybdenum cofactor sulfurase [Dichotomopilus funicola]